MAGGKRLKRGAQTVSWCGKRGAGEKEDQSLKGGFIENDEIKKT